MSKTIHERMDELEDRIEELERDSPANVADYWLTDGMAYAPTNRADVVDVDKDGTIGLFSDEMRGEYWEISDGDRFEEHTDANFGYWVSELEVVPAEEVPSDE